MKSTFYVDRAKNESSNIEFNDYSLKAPFNSKNADYIKRGIRERIRQSSVTVVYLTDKTAGSKWVNWEIRESIAMEKGYLPCTKAILRLNAYQRRLLRIRLRYTLEAATNK